MRKTNVLALVRLELIGSEIRQRAWHLRTVSLAQELLKCGHQSLAMSHLLDGSVLLVQPTEGLAASKSLLAAGLVDEGRRIFELSEPFEFLYGSKLIGMHDEFVVEQWAEAAAHFRSVDQFCSIVQKLCWKVTLETKSWTTARRSLIKIG